MSIFDSILTKIFHRGSTATSVPSPGPQSTAPGPVATASPQRADEATAPVDVEAVLTDLASKAQERLNWRQSIVDLMKLLGLDSSLSARKQLASELHYTGDTSDSATMNIWLHKQVMRKLAENGGKVPDDLKG